MRILAALCVLATATTIARAGDVTTVTSCPSQPVMPVTFVVDCSHVKDAAIRQLCPQFIKTQACTVFPAYRKITGIRLEDRCKTITYGIYDKDNFPHFGGAGGISFNCQIDHMAEYAIQQFANSKIGPYENHEILHHYQMTSRELGAITAFHPLFTSSMLEAQREIGDAASYDKFLGLTENEVVALRAQLERGAIPPAINRCSIARTVIEEGLYLENSKNVYLFYSKLASVVPTSAADREARFNAMLNDIAGGKAKTFLVANGCAPF